MNIELSELRVIDRVKEGGHYVEPQTISSNYFGNLEKLNKHYAMFNNLQVVDTSESAHKVLCVFTDGLPTSTIDYKELPPWFIINLPAMADKIRTNQST